MLLNRLNFKYPLERLIVGLSSFKIKCHKMQSHDKNEVIQTDLRSISPTEASLV